MYDLRWQNLLLCPKLLGPKFLDPSLRFSLYQNHHVLSLLFFFSFFTFYKVTRSLYASTCTCFKSVQLLMWQVDLCSGWHSSKAFLVISTWTRQEHTSPNFPTTLCHYQQYCTYWYGCRLFIYQEWQTIVPLGDLLQDLQESLALLVARLVVMVLVELG